MEHTRTQTNTPPAESVALHQEPRKGSRGPSDPKTRAGEPGPATASAVCVERQDAKGLGCDYVGDVRTSSDHGSITPSQQQELDDLSSQRSGNDDSTLSSQHLQLGGASVLQRGRQSPDLADPLQDSHLRPQHLKHSLASRSSFLPGSTSAIFKPFDQKSGRFMAPSESVGIADATAATGASDDASSSSSSNSSSTSSSSGSNSAGSTTTTTTNTTMAAVSSMPAASGPAPNSNCNTPNTAACAEVDFSSLASLKAAAVKNNKFRSHSVPSILHSSLRSIGLSTSCGFFTSQNQQQQIQPQQHQHQHQQQQQQHQQQQQQHQQHQQSGIHMNRGIKKKKQSKQSASLRHALLMNQRIQPSGSIVSLQDRIKYMESYPGPMPLPPINLQCLKEIDLQEIVKNPQLRHDIIFDPLLQFRPNLDGERGLKKKQISDRYWYDVENEVFVYKSKPEVFRFEKTRLVPLFNSLKEVLVTIVPQKEVHTVQNVLDTELLVQELLKGSLMMSSFADWLAQLFKHHCAPMRDPWVDKMSVKFKESEEEKSIPKLVEGLRLVFQILEAMKLDIANHQIRILRPALLSNAVEFEKQYFQSLMSSNRVDLKSSFKWFDDKCFEYQKASNSLSNNRLKASEVYRLCIRGIISLLSCRKMVREYPTSLSFDHARLILLRADIRQIVCLLVCRLLFKQLVANDSSMDKVTKDHIIAVYSNKKLKGEIVSIITDEHGNCRWTKNTMSIAIHLCKTIRDLKQEFLLQRNLGDVTLAQSGTAKSVKGQAPPLDNAQINFAKSWLSKQTQPLSEVYGVLEARVFQQLENSIFNRSNCTQDGSIKQDFIHLCSTMTSNSSNASTAASVFNSSANIRSLNSTMPFRDAIGNENRVATQQPSGLASVDLEEFESLFCHLYTLANFHWSVFGGLYMDYLGDKMEEVN